MSFSTSFSRLNSETNRESDSKRPIPKVNTVHNRAVKVSKFAPFRLYDLRHAWATERQCPALT
ncbi:MAG TPA: hypothetical protein VGB94_02820 [Acidobacteriaceae bacterium]